MREVVEQITHTLIRGLGDQVVALFLYGSLAQGFHQPGDSDVNLFLVLEDGTKPHRLRELFLPIWEEHGHRLRRAPCLASRKDFSRHLRLNPLLAHHLATEGIQLHGSKELLPEENVVDPQEEFALLAQAAMGASVVLTPQLLQPGVAEDRYRQLRRLARRLSRQPVPEGQPASQLLGVIQHQLSQLQERSPQLERWISPERPSSSLLLPSLEGAYKELGQMVMSFSVLTPHQIAAAGWEELALQLAKHYSGLKLVTSTQLRLIVKLLEPVAHYLQRYEHEWGVDVLSGLQPDRERILRHVAKVASDLLVVQLPDVYLTSEDARLGDLVHTFQNKLLNLQLENELLSRTGIAGRFTAPIPLPDRSAPAWRRIEAIADQLDWWATQYETAADRHGR